MYRLHHRIWSVCLFIIINSSSLFAIKVPGMADLLHNFEAIDPDVVDVFTFNNRPALRNRGDATEIDIMDVDTSDILNCFSTLSYICFQKKIIFYLDSLNRVDKINLFGGYMSFVRISQGVMPPITEQMLASRGINDELSLTTLLRDIFDDFIDSHILRITVPVINARLDARGRSARSHCYDFNLVKVRSDNYTKDTTRELTCYRSDQSVTALSSAFIMKMLMLLPTLLKIIAVKVIFGLVMGTISVVLSKMALLPVLLSYMKKSSIAAGNAASTANAYRQGASPPINYPITTDGYGLYYQQNEQPIRESMAGGAAEDLDSNNESGNFLGPTISPYIESNWAEPKISNKNYNVQPNEIKYAPRKERYRSMSRPAISRMKHRIGYMETSINNNHLSLLLTTVEPIDIDHTNDRMNAFENNGNVRAK